MRGSLLVIHGDASDLKPIFLEWFSGASLIAAETLGSLNKPLAQGTSADFLIDRILTPGATYSDALVIGSASNPLSIEPIQMLDGSGTKQKLSMSNREVVGIRLGGQSGENVLQPTILTTSGDSKDAQILFQRLKKVVTRRSNRIEGNWILPSAFEKWRNGWRLQRGQFQAAYTDLMYENTV